MTKPKADPLASPSISTQILPPRNSTSFSRGESNENYGDGTGTDGHSSQETQSHQIGISTKLEWIDDGDTIRVMPIPLDPIQAAKGISKRLHRRPIKERELEQKLG
jgi:hypothetical protein